MQEKTINALKWIISILDKHKIDYQISGGFAAKMYGSQRKLNDIDIDISEKSFTHILEDISAYIIYGPARYKDEKWDLELITLDYGGQEIDISGVETLKISNKEKTKWITYPNSLSSALTVKVESMDLKIISPQKLIDYKKELDGSNQAEDVLAIEQYIISNSLK